MDKKKPYCNINNPAKILGRKITKSRQGNSKIFKNLSEIPIQINLQLEGKENQSIGTINRPHSSIIDVQHKNFRIQSALSQYPTEQNRKRLSLDSTNKKHQRDSLLSRNSMSKKPSRNQIGIDQTTKLKIADDRRRYNHSCGSATEQRTRNDNRKKFSGKTKRLSVNTLGVRKQQKPRKNEDRSIVLKEKNDKSKSKSCNKKVKKSRYLPLDKSKASTTAIGFGNPAPKKLVKKKQSLSVAVIQPPKEKKKKNSKKQSQKCEILEQYSQEQYPISKYEIQPIKPPRIFLKRKSKSKSRKDSTSKQRHKKTYSLIEQIDYTSCINLPSNSSGLINSLSRSSHGASKIKIIDNFEFRYFIDQNPTSVNMQEIRYYQSKMYPQIQIVNKLSNNRFYKKRKQIQSQITQDYPNFNQFELKFLSSVVFIQRKWRQYHLYKGIFKNFGRYPGITKFIEKSNKSFLNISNGSKSAEKGTNSPQKKVIEQIAFESLDKRLKFENNQKQDSQFSKCKILESNSEISNQKLFFSKKQGQGEEQLSSSLKQIYIKSNRYEFLQSQIFPNITYILLKKEQIKNELSNRLTAINKLFNNHQIELDRYNILKQRYEGQYKQKLKQLNKSKHDIKKGYLKFIDTFKDVKHQALRKVSSESGFMSSMYKKIFHFDQHISTPSDSSQSLKNLTKKILIRKQFYRTQKYESFFQPTGHLSDRPYIVDENFDLSARYFRNKKENLYGQQVKRKEMFIDIEGLSSQRLHNKRIREGVINSPQFQKQGNNLNLIISLSKSNQLVPYSPKIAESFKNSEEQSQNYERRQRLILEQIIASITHQLYTELLSIDQRRENLIAFYPEEEISKYTNIGHLDIIQQSLGQRDQKSDEFQIIEQQKLRQIYKIEGLQQKNSHHSSRRRNSKQYNISPASSQKLAFQSEDILLYIDSFFIFLKNNHMIEEIVQKLNKNQGFTPLQYLKFLRDFQIPDEQYDPLISNQIFIEWEDYFYSKYYPLEIVESDDVFLMRQSVTIFHRCIFESVIFLLEQHRPCGEKGIPFPWQNVPFFNRKIALSQMQKLLSEVRNSLGEILRINCGIIDEKHIIYCQEDLQRIHQENEQKIINMLEKELGQSPDNWFEVQQHCLEIKLELECQIIEYLMLEALDEILENY